MPRVKFSRSYREFITGRDVESAIYYEDGKPGVVAERVRKGD
jgi:hypothetical protein